MAGELVTVALSLMLQVGVPGPQYGAPSVPYGGPQFAAPPFTAPQYGGEQYGGPQYNLPSQPPAVPPSQYGAPGPQVGAPGPSETPNYPALQNAFSQHGHEGQFEQRYPFDTQQNWVHGYFQEIPAYGGHVFFRPYNYKDVMSQSQTSAGWGMSPTMPYSQQFWHRYHDQATMLKLSRSNPGHVPAAPTMSPGVPAPQPLVMPAAAYAYPTAPANFAPQYAPQSAVAVPQFGFDSPPVTFAPPQPTRNYPVQTTPVPQSAITSGPFLAPQ